MSLTSFIEGSSEVRGYLLDAFPKPESRRPQNLLAPPRSERYWLIGTAFDYYFRWYLQHLNPNSVFRTTWIAEQAVALISNPHRRQIAKDVVARARRRLGVALRTGRFTRTLATSAIEVARLDPIFRAGIGEDQIDEPVSPLDVLDVQRLLSIVPIESFTSSRPCFLNPVLEASNLVMGADADLVVRSMLVDIKVTKDPKIYRSYFNQLLGYYLLFRLGGLYGPSVQPRITRLGVYMARFGHLATWTIAELGSEQRFAKAARWFRSRAVKEFPQWDFDPEDAT